MFYLFTGLGAAFLHMAYNGFEVYQLAGNLAPSMQEAYRIARVAAIYHTPVVGASGAVYGLLMAYGMLFPNTNLYIMFLPIPIKAKYLVLGMIGISLFLGLSQFENDSIAHFAHLGGMLFGFLLLKFWQKDNTRFY